MVKVAIANSSPLIALGRIGKLELLRRVLGSVSITEQVYQEIMSKPDYSESVAIKKAVEEDKWIKVSKSKEIDNILGVGEASTLGLTLMSKQLVIIDDKKASFVADTIGLECHGTLYVILLALKKGIIRNKKEAVDVVNLLIGNKLYLSSEVLSEFYALLSKIN